MIKTKRIILPIVLLLHAMIGNSIQAKREQTRQVQRKPTQARQPQAQPVAPQQTQAMQRLSDFYFTSASVLPFFTENKTRYTILSREARGTDVGTYDDFGGSREFVDPKTKKIPKEKHPVIVAAREFFEEAILQFSTNFFLNENKVRDFIDLSATASNTEFIIAYLKNVTYITDFNPYKDQLFNKFYIALNKAKSLGLRDFTEKDRLAKVEWNKLATTIAQSKFNTNVTIEALVLNPHDGKWHKEQIILRGFFVKKLRPFFAGSKKYKTGLNQKIRFYDEDAAIIVPAEKQLIQPRPQASWLARFWSWVKS